MLSPDFFNSATNAAVALVGAVAVVFMRALFFMIKRYISNQDIRMRDNLADHNDFKRLLADHDARIAAAESHIDRIEKEAGGRHGQ